MISLSIVNLRLFQRMLPWENLKNPQNIPPEGLCLDPRVSSNVGL